MKYKEKINKYCNINCYRNGHIQILTIQYYQAGKNISICKIATNGAKYINIWGNHQVNL